MTMNDELILELKKRIEEKRKALVGDEPKFEPVTNCSLPDGPGVMINLHILTLAQCAQLWARLVAIQKAAEELGIEGDIEVGGWNIRTWIGDVKSKYLSLKYASSRGELTKMEKRLDALLSEDKRTEMELEKIKRELGL
jgi:hypothetical protein